jgi:hypothetical protein
MTIQAITPFLTPLMIVIAAIAYYMTKRGEGKQDVGKQVIENYAALDQQQKESISEKDKTIGELHSELKKSQENCIAQTSKLQGIVDQQEKTIHSQNEIITNRNPELVAILNQNLEINTKVAQFMETLIGRMDESVSILNQQTEMLETGQKRNQKIDEATSKEVGHVLRK